MFMAQQAGYQVGTEAVDGYTSGNLDPTKSRLNPYTNYTASNADPGQFGFIQVWELGNSPAAITGTIPQQFSNDPKNNPDLEPGKQLTDCVKSGGPLGQQY